MGEKEYLCGVCLLKRLGKYAFADILPEDREIDFPSVAEVAVSDFKLTLLQNEPVKFANYVENCRSLFKKDFAHKTDLLEKVKAKTDYDGDNIGGEFFIQDFLTEKNLKKALDLDATKHLPDGKADELEALQKELQKITGSYFSPSSYYAVIMMDGDNMGKWLKGDFAPTVDQIFHSRVWKKLPSSYQKELMQVFDKGKRPMSPAIHSAISAALRDYSLGFAKRIVEDEHLGKLIYAGGDDVLALLNLRNLLSVMKKLRAAFSGHINDDLQVDFKADVSGFVDTGDNLLVTMGPKATASMGVAIAHYKMPFSMVLDKAREMEKKAKKVDGKDAFAIALMKHSGEMRECAAKWDYKEINKPGGTIELIETLAKLIRCEDLSNKFIYSLRDDFFKLSV
jgi:CRISPR-associated protein Cmr2